MSNIKEYAPRFRPVKAIQVTSETVDEAAEWVNGVTTKGMAAIGNKHAGSKNVNWVGKDARPYEGTASTLMFMPITPPDGYLQEKSNGDKLFVRIPVSPSSMLAVSANMWIVQDNDWFQLMSNKRFSKMFVIPKETEDE